MRLPYLLPFLLKINVIQHIIYMKYYLLTIREYDLIVGVFPTFAYDFISAYYLKILSAVFLRMDMQQFHLSDNQILF